jgi:hypothetical protein
MEGRVEMEEKSGEVRKLCDQLTRLKRTYDSLSKLDKSPEAKEILATAIDRLDDKSYILEQDAYDRTRQKARGEPRFLDGIDRYSNDEKADIMRRPEAMAFCDLDIFDTWARVNVVIKEKPKRERNRGRKK